MLDGAWAAVEPSNGVARLFATALATLGDGNDNNATSWLAQFALFYTQGPPAQGWYHPQWALPHPFSVKKIPFRLACQLV